MQAALKDLAASVHFSEHFDPDVQVSLTRLAEGKAKSLHDFLIAIPQIAEETFRHIHATQDERATDAWSAISSQMNENGFSLASIRHSAKTR
jgi:hypothetical protein